MGIKTHVDPTNRLVEVIGEHVDPDTWHLVPEFLAHSVALLPLGFDGDTSLDEANFGFRLVGEWSKNAKGDASGYALDWAGATQSAARRAGLRWAGGSG